MLPVRILIGRLPDRDTLPQLPWVSGASTLTLVIGIYTLR